MRPYRLPQTGLDLPPRAADTKGSRAAKPLPFCTPHSWKGPPMMVPLPATEVLTREFLEIRAKILEIGAALDRIDRADGAVGNDPRMSRIRQGLAALAHPSPDRAEQIQLLFSITYDEDWQTTLSVPRH